MRLVGAFYVLLGAQNVPPLVAARLGTQYPTLAAPPESVAVQALLDMWFLFGASLAVVGVMLLVASADPLRNRVLIQTVLLLEVFRGVFMDLYWVSRGFYVEGFYVGFALVHLSIVVTGLVLLRRAARETRGTASSTEPLRASTTRGDAPAS